MNCFLSLLLCIISAKTKNKVEKNIFNFKSGPSKTLFYALRQLLNGQKKRSNHNKITHVKLQNCCLYSRLIMDSDVMNISCFVKYSRLVSDAEMTPVASCMGASLCKGVGG